MRIRHLKAIGPSAVILSMVVFLSPTATTAQNPTMLKTPWGEPDLQGIWTDETDTPLQRPARFANQEFFSPEGKDAPADRVGPRQRSEMTSNPP